MLSIIDILSLFFDMFIIIVYFSKMLGKRKEQVKPVLYYSCFFLMETLLCSATSITGKTTTSIRFLILVFLSTITSYFLTLLFNATVRHRIFVTVSFQIYCNLGEILTAVIMTSLTANPLLNSELIYNFLSKIILFVLVIVTILITRHKNNNYNIQYNIMILLTPLTSILIVMAIAFPFFDDNNPTLASYLQFSSVAGLIILNIANYLLLGNIIDSVILREKEQLLVTQIQKQSEKYDMISAGYRETRQLIHDTKKHYFFIRSAAEKGQYNDIIESVNNELNSLEIEHVPVNSGNLVIDSLVGNYIQLAKQEGITFKTNIHITPRLVPVKDYNLCVIIGNLLENSLNACRKINRLSDRNILFETYTSDKDFIIHVSNSISDTQFENKDSDYTINHGYGMLNIENIVNNYYGIYTNEIKNDRFSSIIVIPVRINMKSNP